jgi:DNA invertase Pin-like site-specific DNA recombinase
MIDTRTAAGRFAVNILASVHQWEAERLRERIRANLAHMRAQGMWVGGNVPYGFKAGPRHYDDDGRRLPRKLTPNPDEQAVIKEARKLRRNGFSLRRIAMELGRLRLRSRTGGSFSAQQVSGMLEPESAAS